MKPDSDATLFDLTARYPDEESAVRYFESLRWPKGPRCLSCKTADVVRGQTERRRQIWHCRKCGEQFTVTMGTVMEDTKLPLRKWLLAFHLIGASKKGMSALQLARMLGVSYKTAWHLGHRIRATMTDGEYVREGPRGRLVTTNTAEGLFANLKRQITGTHHHTSKRHLPKYLEEYDYKYNTRKKSDGARTVAAIKRAVGKRLTLYRTRNAGVPSLFEGPAPRR